MENNSLTARLLRRDLECTDAVQSTARSPTSANSIDLTGRRFRLPSGKVITILEDTGFDSYLCAYDLPDLKLYVKYSRAELEDARKVEFMKNFIYKFGKEC